MNSTSATRRTAESTRWGNCSGPPGEAAAPAPPASWRPTILAAGLIGLAALAGYHNSFVGPFIHDDAGAIVENPTIRQLWPIGPVLSPPSSCGETVAGRPLLNLSLAVNYALGGLHVWGYHAANLLIHTAAALVLFGILRQTFLLPGLRDRFGGPATPLALAIALLWTVHPLQTESVAYISQRAESLVGLFYLLTLYCVIRGGATAGLSSSAGSTVGEAGHRPNVGRGTHAKKRTVPLGSAGKGTVPFSLRENRDSPRLWYAAAVLACLLGMACKEVMVTAPLVVLLYDRTFLAGSCGETWRRRWGLYVGLAATWGVLAYLVFSTGLMGRQSELGAPDPWSYARSQPGVILHYLRLAVWPRPLCLLYEWPVATALGEILPGAIVLGLLAAATLWGLTGRKAWSFLGAWFLLILAPTSSILPLVQLTCEHRMYLPLAALAVLVVAGGYAFWDGLLPRPAGQRGQSPFPPGVTPGRFGLWAAEKGTVPARAAAVRWAAPVAALAAVLTALGYLTIVRNSDYRSSLAIWQDTVQKRPHDSLAHYALASTLAVCGRTDEAIEQYREALRLKPGYAKAHNDLGTVLARLGRIDEAIECYREALRLSPDFAMAHYNLGNELVKAGMTSEAIDHYQQALRFKPDYLEAHNNLAAALTALGRIDEAIKHYQEALRLRPDFAAAHYNLSNNLAKMGKTSEAIEHYQEALRLKPDYVEGHNNLAIALADVDRTDEAIQHYREALRLKPDFPQAHYNLANILAALGRTREAIGHYDQLVQLMPNSQEGLNNLAWLLASSEPGQGGDPTRAVQLAQRARELGGQQSAQCLDTLAAAYAAAGRFPDAVLIAERAVQLAESTGQAPLAGVIRARLELYHADRPYRAPARSPAHDER